MGWKLRCASGRRRRVSVMRPTVEAVVSWSYQEPKGPSRSVSLKAGTTTVPSGPTAAKKPSMTDLAPSARVRRTPASASSPPCGLPAPPITWPMLFRELWKKTVSPVATPREDRPAVTSAAVVLRAARPTVLVGELGGVMVADGAHRAEVAEDVLLQ